MLLATSAVVSFLGLFYAGERLSGSRGIVGDGGRARGGGDSRTGGGSGASPRLAGPVAIALMISIGIGLHNFGEGLAIGAAVGLGSVAFSSFLIVGFAIHNVTEGVAIAAPLSRERVAVWKLAGLGVLAGAPAIFGGWVGGFAYSPIASVVFLGVGAGAIFQVMVVLVRWVGRGDSPANGSNASGASGGGLSGAPFAAGIVVGMLIMYVTSILV